MYYKDYGIYGIIKLNDTLDWGCLGRAGNHVIADGSGTGTPLFENIGSGEIYMRKWGKIIYCGGYRDE
ncbi:MAG: hypothetical protein LUH22_01840 [Bacteroides sp.]|nr:hypothetical protein [Bacteroides sp.]